MPQKNKTFRVCTNTPVRNQNGRWLFRQCRPKLRTIQPITQNRLTDNRKTVGDVLGRLEYNRRLYNIVRGDK